ncbi:MAG TPA: histidine--tRNA ligase [Candidatus Saccharimonadales bacterium]|nr:histidine--tRNA ligase [Candidatus Saccharimonadales bacterium]
MNQLSAQPYKGARDFYPEDMRIRNYIFDTWKRVAKKYGYEEYDFPIVEPFEIFASKSGEELVNEQLFSFEDKGGRKLALRPEITPGTVRMIAQKFKELPRPIRWFMIGNNWRFEKPQTGRGREFYQLEVNIFGISDILADFELFSLIIDLMKAFGADNSMFEIKVSDRRLISALPSDLLKLSTELQIKVRRLMDKRLKMEQAEFLSGLADLGLSEEQAQTVEKFMSSSLENLPNIIPQSILQSNLGYTGIRALFELLQSAGLAKYCVFAPSIIRGFDYSDGLVYEVFDKNPQNRRSMFGGERFDKLIQIFGNYELPATGFAMGDMPLLEFLTNWKLLPTQTSSTEYLVTLWNNEPKYLNYSLKIAEKLRAEGKNVEVWLENSKIDKQIKYADKKGIANVVIAGEEELKNKTVTVKNLKTGKQETQ